MNDDDDDEPLTVREIDNALAPYLTRADRRRFIRAFKDAELIAFFDEPC